METLCDLLTIYSWTMMALVFLCLFLIARFYEKKAGQRSYYQLFLLPLFLFGLSAARYLLSGCNFAGDMVGDGLLFLGGLTLGSLGFFLINLMSGRKR